MTISTMKHIWQSHKSNGGAMSYRRLEVEFGLSKRHGKTAQAICLRYDEVLKQEKRKSRFAAKSVTKRPTQIRTQAKETSPSEPVQAPAIQAQTDPQPDCQPIRPEEYAHRTFVAWATGWRTGVYTSTEKVSTKCPYQGNQTLGKAWQEGLLDGFRAKEIMQNKHGIELEEEGPTIVSVAEEHALAGAK